MGEHGIRTGVKSCVKRALAKMARPGNAPIEHKLDRVLNQLDSLPDQVARKVDPYQTERIGSIGNLIQSPRTEPGRSCNTGSMLQKTRARRLGSFLMGLSIHSESGSGLDSTNWRVRLHLSSKVPDESTKLRRHETCSLDSRLANLSPGRWLRGSERDRSSRSEAGHIRVSLLRGLPVPWWLIHWLRAIWLRGS